MLVLWTRNSESVVDELNVRGQYLSCKLSAQLYIGLVGDFQLTPRYQWRIYRTFRCGPFPRVARPNFYEVTVHGRLVRGLLLQAQLL